MMTNFFLFLLIGVWCLIIVIVVLGAIEVYHLRLRMKSFATITPRKNINQNSSHTDDVYKREEYMPRVAARFIVRNAGDLPPPNQYAIEALRQLAEVPPTTARSVPALTAALQSANVNAARQLSGGAVGATAAPQLLSVLEGKLEANCA